MFITFYFFTDYSYGIRLSQRVDGKVLVTFNARNEHDRCKFAEDLKESVLEMDEMENLRIEAELERQKSNRGNRTGKYNFYLNLSISFLFNLFKKEVDYKFLFRYRKS